MGVCALGEGRLDVTTHCDPRSLWHVYEQSVQGVWTCGALRIILRLQHAVWQHALSL